MADEMQRSVLPIPDRVYVGLTTYDAKDPDTSFPKEQRSNQQRSSRKEKQMQEEEVQMPTKTSDSNPALGAGVVLNRFNSSYS